MVSSKGTAWSLAWRRSCTTTVTGLATVAPARPVRVRPASTGRSASAGQLGQRPVLDQLGVVPEKAAQGPRCRLHQAGGRDQDDDGRRVLDHRPQPGLLIAGHLEASTFGEVPEAEEHDRLAPPGDGCPDHLYQAPTCARLHPDLDQRADLLALDARQRPEHELQVIGMDEVEPGYADRFLERPGEQAFGSMVAPLDLA